MKKIKDVLIKVEDYSKKIPKNLWSEYGKLPIVSQDSFKKISGYTNDTKNNSIKDYPLIVFGDHTCIFKYVDFEFLRGADGTQLLKPNNSYNTQFFYYLLLHIRNKIPDLNKYQRHFKYLKDMDISTYEFDLTTQIKISDVLSTLDKKIELNVLLNKEFEKIAKTIYDYWFVQFDFPDENGKPYKSSGGEMVWNEELKKEIPKNWEVKKLGDLMSSKRKKYDLKSNIKADTIDLSIMPSSTFSLNLKNSSENFKTNLFELEKYDLLFGSIRPYLLKAGFSPIKGAVNGSVLSFKPFEEYCFNFLLLTLTNKSMFEYAVSNSRGTRMPVVKDEDILNYKVAFDKNTVLKFSNLELKEIISNNINQNFELSELRDFLLPLLMNGQIKIND